MKLTNILIAVIALLLFSCENDTTKEEPKEIPIEEQIVELENELFGDQNAKMDKRKALDMVNLYVDFANKYPDDPKSPDYLFKAADISMNLNRPSKTIHIYDVIMYRYPDYSKTPTALFLKAFVFEDQMQNYKEAKLNYELFIEKYPDSEFADDALMSLKNLGKTPEELIREFEQNEQE